MSTQTDSPLYSISTWQGNVIDDYGVLWVVETEDGWSSSPPVRPTLNEKSAGDGAWSGPGFYASRVINLTGKAYVPSQVEMLRAKDRIKAAVNPRTALQLRVDELHLSRVATVRMSDRVDLQDHGAHAFTWALTLVAADHRRYSPDTVTVSTTLPTTLTV
ncbi:hypothetical protein AB0B89_36260, partial [Sphaerisporangium sp. NPDC049002]|uniref:hypothetical protein n=1 Tax=Sphaerisporangium sp. NPDC049002 TaxID=3155392 RepID=UPI0033C84D7C